MSQYTVDHVQRMKQIKANLDENTTSEDAVQQKQNMLEELMDIVDNIDNARGMLLQKQTHLLSAQSPLKPVHPRDQVNITHRLLS